MRTQLFWGAVVACIPLILKAHVHSEHEVTTDEVQQELPGSRELHKKLNQPTFYEKQHLTIRFKKKTSEDVELKDKMILKWTGPMIKELKGTLFKKTTEELIPIRENLVADGRWDQENQRLIFTFKNAHPLHGITTFSLVLKVNPELEEKLRKGSFSLEQSSIPEPFRSPQVAPDREVSNSPSSSAIRKPRQDA